MKRGLLIVAVLMAACGGPSQAARSATHDTTTQAKVATAASPSGVTSIGAAFNFLKPTASVPSASNLEITCSGSIGPADPVAIVQLHGGEVVLRDYADLAHPNSVCHFSSANFTLHVIDPRHVIVGGFAGGLYAIVDLPGVQFHWFQLPGHSPTFVAVSPRLDQVAWLSADIAGNTDQVHLTTSDGDHVVSTLPNPHGGRCGSPEDSLAGAFTNSGKYLFVLDQPIPTLNGLLVIEGNRPLLRIIPNSNGWTAGEQPAMAVWSPTSETLYYRKSGSVWKWTPSGGSQQFLPGVSWYYPTISPDGRHLAYAVVGSDGLHDVYLIDLPSGSPKKLSARNLPVFLNSTQLWYKSESQGTCGPGGNQPLVYDLTDGSESSSVIDQVYAVWPATSSNF